MGGLVGFYIGDATVSYSTGSATGTYEVGALFGFLSGSSVISSCYWDMESSGNSTSDGGVGLFTSQMLQSLNFLGFDFDTYWDIVEGETRPFLWMQNSTIYADFEYSGSEKNGEYTTPFSDLESGVHNTPYGGLLILQGGFSSEQITINKKIRLDSLITVRLGE